MMKPSKLLQRKIEEYVSIAIYWTLDVNQITRMVILHFNIPDKQAKQIVTDYLKEHHPQIFKEFRTKI